MEKSAAVTNLSEQPQHAIEDQDSGYAPQAKIETIDKENFNIKTRALQYVATVAFLPSMLLLLYLTYCFRYTWEANKSICEIVVAWAFLGVKVGLTRTLPPTIFF